jgi:hypothetical protein
VWDARRDPDKGEKTMNEYIKVTHSSKKNVSWKVGIEGVQNIIIEMHPKHDEASIIAMEGFQGEKWTGKEVIVYIPFCKLSEFADKVRAKRKEVNK